MCKFINATKAPFEIVKIIARYEPSYLWWSLPQIIINSILPLLNVYAPKLIIEKLTDASPYADVLRVIIPYCTILLLLNILNKILSGKSSFAADKFTEQLRYEIGKITMHLEMKDIETASSREVIGLAANAADLTATLAISQQMISNVITICGLAVITASLDWIFLSCVAVVLIIKTCFTYFRYNYDKKMRPLRMKNQEVGAYLSEMEYFSHGAEKEIRVNSVQSWFLDKIKGYRREMLLWQYKDFRYYALFEILLSVIVALQSLVILLMLANKYITGIISIADFTMYFTAVASLTTVLSSFTEQIGNYNKQVLNVNDYKKLMALISIQKEGVIGDTIHIGTEKHIEIVFDDVSFVYPNASANALAHINLRIKNGEKLVVVGLNGAGKTTLIKLLCKFYCPTEGKITVNGIDIWSIPNDEYFSLIGAVFQDYQNFAFSVIDNVSLNNNAERERIEEILNNLGMNNFIQANTDGLDTYISKTFSQNGVELSGGEGQKLAIARAIYKNAPLLILDEPTASLDAKSESEIYADFFEMSKNKTAIYISHRLAASTIADNIAVFGNGKIVEYGSHANLIKLDGLYAEMYERQSKPYVEAKGF